MGPPPSGLLHSSRSTYGARALGSTSSSIHAHTLHRVTHYDPDGWRCRVTLPATKRHTDRSTQPTYHDHTAAAGSFLQQPRCPIVLQPVRGKFLRWGNAKIGAKFESLLERTRSDENPAEISETEVRKKVSFLFEVERYRES